MKLSVLLRRFFVPGWMVTLLCLLRNRSKISPRAEVELSSNLQLGRECVVGSFTKIKTSGGPMRIGAGVHIATGCHLSSESAGLSIGDGTVVGPNCVILNSGYNTQAIGVSVSEQGFTSKGTRIGKNVFLGANTVVLDGADIGDDVIVAPNSMIFGHIAQRSFVMGNPAKVIYKRR